MARRGAPRTNLPVERGAFVGRERALVALAKALGEGTQPIVALVGPAGVGKTRLALRAAARELPRCGHDGGVWLVECLGAEDGAGLVRLVGLMLGLLPDVSATDDQERARIATVLCERGASLIVVDGIDGVSDAVGALEALAALVPDTHFLITTREPVSSPMVQTFTVPPLSLKRDRRPQDLSEAAQLFVERSNEARGSLARAADSAERQAIDAIVKHLEGLPQAIELAAARCRVLTPAELLERLPRHAPGASVSGRRSALAGVVAWSLDLLQPWERATLAQAVIFHGGFTLDAAREVIDLSEVPEAPKVEAAIESLVEKALLKLIVATDDELAPRYTHPVAVRELIVQVKPQRRATETVRTSTLELLPGARSGEGAVAEVPRLELFTTRDALVRRHAAWVLSRCGGLRENVDGHGGLLARHELEAEQDNLLAVVRRALSDDAASLTSITHALLALVALEPVMTTRGPHDLFGRLLDRTVTRAEPAGLAPGLLARVLELRARVFRASGKLARSKEDLDAALVQARRARDRILEARALANLGTHSLATGDLAGARSAYDAAIAIVREQGDVRLEGRCVGFYGLLEEELGALDVAADHYDTAISIHRKVGDRRYEGIHLAQLGRIRYAQGDVEGARELLRRALVIHRELMNRRPEAHAVLLQGDIAATVGDAEEAQGLWSRAGSIARDVGDPGILALVHARLAAADRAVGNDARAHDIVVDAAVARVDDAAIKAAVAICRGGALETSVTVSVTAAAAARAMAAIRAWPVTRPAI